MRFNFKRIVRFLTVSILCLLSVSCSLLLNGTGNIQFKLPALEQSCSDDGIAVAAANNQTDFNIVLKTQNGRTVYNEFHEAGSVVYIDNIPSGKYEISLEAITHTDIYSGKENVHVKAGKGSAVNVRLGKNPITQNDDKKYGFFSGIIEDSTIEDIKNFEMYVRVYTQDGNKTLVDEQKVNNSLSYKTSPLEVGKYILCISGRDTKAYYSQEFNISNMKEGENKLAPIPLTKSGLYDIKLKFTKGPVPAEKLHVKLLTNSGVEFLSTDVMSDHTCHFNAIPEGEYLVCANSTNWEVNDVKIIVAENKTFDIELQLNNK